MPLDARCFPEPPDLLHLCLAGNYTGEVIDLVRVIDTQASVTQLAKHWMEHISSRWRRFSLRLLLPSPLPFPAACWLFRYHNRLSSVDPVTHRIIHNSINIRSGQWTACM